MKKTIRLLVVQRISLSHDLLLSRSISARFLPLLCYMKRHNLIEWEEIPEHDVSIGELRRFDAVLFNKHSSTRALDIMETANDLGMRTIYDLDDWIMDLPSYSVTNLNDDLLANIFKMIKESTIVTVSNSFLKEKLKRTGASTKILPNGFDHELFESRSGIWKESNPPKILFSNTDGIKLVRFKQDFISVVSGFMMNHPDVILEFWGDPFPEMGLIPNLIPRGFLENTQYKLSIRDAGYLFAIIPLGGEEDPDSLFFNKCKTPIKYIDYGSLGIPGIYSKSPVYEEVVTHRETGYLIPNERFAWCEAMNELYNDPSQRNLLRTNAYADTIGRFNISSCADIFHKILVDPIISDCHGLIK